MFRVHFTAQDLMRVTFAPRPAPLLELGLAAATLQRRDDLGVFGRWRTARWRELPAAAAPLLSLVPPNGASPTFLDPLTETFEEGLETVRAAPRVTVTRELRRVCPAYRPLTSWVRDLAHDDREAWRNLDKAVRVGYAVLVSGHWERMRTSFFSDLAWRGRVQAEHGVGDMLAGLYPGSRWSGTTLEIASPRDSDLVLTGAGVTLMPSSVWTAGPLIGCEPDGRYTLYYPALTPLPMTPEEPDVDPLVTLLGRTRAAVLRTLQRQHTTGELAAELGISVASASQHTKTLRAAGLVTSQRDGKHVWHTATPLGAGLFG